MQLADHGSDVGLLQGDAFPIMSENIAYLSCDLKIFVLLPCEKAHCIRGLHATSERAKRRIETFDQIFCLFASNKVSQQQAAQRVLGKSSQCESEAALVVRREDTIESID